MEITIILDFSEINDLGLIEKKKYQPKDFLLPLTQRGTLRTFSYFKDYPMLFTLT